MEAVELSFPVKVATVPKFLGMEGLVRAGVTVRELESCESDRLLGHEGPPYDPSRSVRSDKEITNAVSASDSEPSKLGGQLLNSLGGDLSMNLHGRGKNGFLLKTGDESAQLERKPGKVSKLGSLSTKRPRISQLEDPVRLARVDGIEDMPVKLGSYLTKCSSSDKTQSAKQRNNFTSKRSDKRNLKLLAKSKYDSSSVKAALESFSSAAGGNYFFGIHGLKSDNGDVTKLVDDVPLNELLNGIYKCPTLGKDKGKKPANFNDSFLNSVRKACSVLQQSNSVQPHPIADVDSNRDKIMPPWLLSTTESVASGVNDDKEDTFLKDLSSRKEVQESDIKSETRINPLDLPLCEPKYILERLALPPHMDLESLLLDAVKPASFSKSNPDPCSGKQVFRRASLPPFAWSHTSTGHSRTSSDPAKLSTGRGTCQGRWLRVEKNVVSSLGVATDVTDLESLTYDHKLVPSAKLRVPGSENKFSPSTSASVPRCQRDSSSNRISSKDSYVLTESECKVNLSGNADGEHCPKVLAAAQTLRHMATRSSRQNPDGIIRWPKMPLQKAMKARKLKSIEKPEEAYGTSVAVSGSDNHRRSMDGMLPPKKPKLSSTDEKKDFSNFSFVRKGPLSWSTPRSSRSSPSRSLKKSIVDIRHPTADAVKQSYTMPPPSRVPEKGSNKRDRVTKLLKTEWNRGRERLD